MYLNKSIVAGTLLENPEQNKEKNVCTFTIKTKKIYRDSNGDKKEPEEYHRIVVFGKQGSIISTYKKKGDYILVEGYMKTRERDNKGTHELLTEIVAENIQYLPNQTYKVGQEIRKPE